MKEKFAHFLTSVDYQLQHGITQQPASQTKRKMPFEPAVSIPLSLENRLILACASTDPNLGYIQALVERGPDWQEIVRKTERLSLAPLVHASLRDAVQSGSVPASVAERLKHVYRREAIRGMAVREALQEILLRLQAAGIPVVVLKGAALAALVYTSPNLRTMGDMDLLVHRGDLDEVDSYSTP